MVHKERLKDIMYEKGHGEGIAKVCCASLMLKLLLLPV